MRVTSSTKVVLNLFFLYAYPDGDEVLKLMQA